MVTEIYEFLNSQGLINFGVIKVRPKHPIGSFFCFFSWPT